MQHSNPSIPFGIAAIFVALLTFNACTKQAAINELTHLSDQPNQPLTPAPQPPPGCSSTKPGGLKETYNIVSNTGTFQWNAVTGATGYEVLYQPVSCEFVLPQWSILNTLSNSVQVPLSDYSLYAWKVRPVCPQGTGTFSDARFFTTSGDWLPLRYCQSKGDAYSHWIEEIILSDFTRLSSDNLDAGYHDTIAAATLKRGTTYTIQYNPAYTFSAYYSGQTTCHWKVYIDYNHSNSFDPSKCEEIMSTTTHGSAADVSNFTVPTWAPVGVTRIRVSMKYGGYPTPCEKFGSGEVEDFRVNIVP